MKTTHYIFGGIVGGGASITLQSINEFLACVIGLLTVVHLGVGLWFKLRRKKSHDKRQKLFKFADEE